AEDPAGSGFLPRKLKRCPRKAKCFFRNGRLEYYQVTSKFIHFVKHLKTPTVTSQDNVNKNKTLQKQSIVVKV
ncbi:hypothetical protein, partial [Virgibacillus halodenitrificans]|uniref:hypothetical protein n=1 Tax=Virgibacillus halodenitrificans TaxID=1482 RepID=UPI0004753474